MEIFFTCQKHAHHSYNFSKFKENIWTFYKLQNHDHELNGNLLQLVKLHGHTCNAQNEAKDLACAY
jgi:hypothetical protein